MEQVMPTYKRIDHVALHVADIDKSIAFYETHFGCENYYQHKSSRGFRIAYLKLGDTVLELVDRSDGPMTGFHFCFETDDFDGAVAALQGDGVECIQPPHHTDAREAREQGWRRVVFRGPDGESIELRG
jgi:lactoylglutathione lyase